VHQFKGIHHLTVLTLQLFNNNNKC